MLSPQEKPDSGMIHHQSPQELIATLQQQIARLEMGRRPQDQTPVSSGCPPLDELLPDHGFRPGTLIEWFCEGDGTGVATLALLAAREACFRSGVLVVMDEHRQFYPPAAARLGIDLERMIIVRAAGTADNLWAMDQALRCPAVTAVLGWPEKLDGRTFRRLQLGAEQGGGLGLLVRPLSRQHEPSWAEVRLLVEPLPATAAQNGRRLKIKRLRSHGQSCGASIEVEVDDETCTVRLVARLDHPATHSRANRA